jgi:1-acyl-sn-glycerol-3-phosphate acyltransferase
MGKSLERARSFLIWAVTLPVFVVACLVVWLASFLLRGRAFEGVIKASCRLVLLVAGVRVGISGRENLVPGRQYVVMMNHVNFFDPLVFYAAFPGLARGAEEESHLRWRDPPHRPVPHRP